LNVGQLIKYTGTVPDWLTGIDKNPLAGVMGLLFLTILAIWTRKKTVLSER
ncbi:MAG: LPXTG cell wall anchor domain-containing protein, partial [Microcystis sp.]